MQTAAGDSRSVTLDFAISDTGIGVPKDRAAALFSPFVQADASTTRKYGGTGLGLAISKQLVEMMGGRIGFDSEEGRGSTFRFTAVFEKQQTAHVKPANTPDDLRGVRVLVLDDRESSRQVVSELLMSWECRISEAADAASALPLLYHAAQDGDPFRIALLDKDMPDANGEEIARRIAADPRLTSTRLLLMTPFGEPVSHTFPLIPCVSKPLVAARLREALTGTLGHKTDPQPPLRPPPRKSAARILLVEDNAINQEVALAILGRLANATDACHVIASRVLIAEGCTPWPFPSRSLD